jgi:hypothetical protein
MLLGWQAFWGRVVHCAPCIEEGKNLENRKKGDVGFPEKLSSERVNPLLGGPLAP